jgi:hypothetical protein
MMVKPYRLVIAMGLLAALAATGAQAKGRCVTAGGTADMVTEDLAKFMANAALQNSIKAHGWKAVGPVKMDCKAGLPVNCTARQRACS